MLRGIGRKLSRQHLLDLVHAIDRSVDASLLRIASPMQRLFGTVVRICQLFRVSILGCIIVESVTGIAGHLAARQELRWVNRLALLANFKMQFYGVGIGISHFRYFLAFVDGLTLFDQDGFVMRVG